MMRLLNDYFLLYHGTKLTFDCQVVDFEATFPSKEVLYHTSMLLLSLNRRNYKRCIALKTFNDIISAYYRIKVTTLEEIHQLQHYSIDRILRESTPEDIAGNIEDTLSYLYKNSVIIQSDYEKLMSLFDRHELNAHLQQSLPINHSDTLTFHEKKQQLQNDIDQISLLLCSDRFGKEIKTIQNYLDNQRFSIGITGIMNAGKSTLLNALMHQEILGSSVVPETANLTIINYSTTPCATLVYWNIKEWQSIENSSNESPSIKKFVDETINYFHDDFDDLIQDQSKRVDVSHEDIISFTSAKSPTKQCNLIKYVELKTDLEFLNDGIEIVDTPGLDDPIIQREEITKEYITQCDLMIHLMNVNQSATLKDIEFIIDALLYQNITKLLVVITRADTVTPKELDEVISYTKFSIKKQLHTLNKESRLDYILQTIEFIPLSGQMALYHRTNRSDIALEAGYQLEDTGILEIERYLNQTLYGKESTKSELIIHSVQSQLIELINSSLKRFDYELVLLSKSKKELEQELKALNIQKFDNENRLLEMEQDIHQYKKEAQYYIDSLDTFLNGQWIELEQTILQRTIGDVRYSFEKEGKRSSSQRIKTIIQTALKDGIVDMVRDYRYKFIKKAQVIAEKCEQKYQELGFSLGHNNDHFNLMTFFQNDFKSGFLTSNYDTLITHSIRWVSQSKRGKLSLLNQQLEESLRQDMVPIRSSLEDKIHTISQGLMDKFFTLIQTPLEQCREKLDYDESLLHEQLKSMDHNDQDRNERSLEIHRTIKQLQTIKQSYKR